MDIPIRRARSRLVSGSLGGFESVAPWPKIMLQPRESFLYCRLSASGAWELKRGLCGFFVARITKIGRLLI
jgi:hypothetical protein